MDSAAALPHSKSVFAIIRKMHFWNKGFLFSNFNLLFAKGPIFENILLVHCFFLCNHILVLHFEGKSRVSSSISTNKHTQKKIAKKLHHLYDYGYDKLMSPHRLSLHST